MKASQDFSRRFHRPFIALLALFILAALPITFLDACERHRIESERGAEFAIMASQAIALAESEYIGLPDIADALEQSGISVFVVQTPDEASLFSGRRLLYLARNIQNGSGTSIALRDIPPGSMVATRGMLPPETVARETHRRNLTYVFIEFSADFFEVMKRHGEYRSMSSRMVRAFDLLPSLEKNSLGEKNLALFEASVIRKAQVMILHPEGGLQGTAAQIKSHAQYLQSRGANLSPAHALEKFEPFNRNLPLLLLVMLPFFLYFLDFENFRKRLFLLPLAIAPFAFLPYDLAAKAIPFAASALYTLVISWQLHKDRSLQSFALCLAALFLGSLSLFVFLSDNLSIILWPPSIFYFSFHSPLFMMAVVFALWLGMGSGKKALKELGRLEKWKFLLLSAGAIVALYLLQYRSSATFPELLPFEKEFRQILYDAFYFRPRFKEVFGYALCAFGIAFHGSFKMPHIMRLVQFFGVAIAVTTVIDTVMHVTHAIGYELARIMLGMGIGIALLFLFIAARRLVPKKGRGKPAAF